MSDAHDKPSDSDRSGATTCYATDRDHQIIDAVSIALDGRIGYVDDAVRLRANILCGGGRNDKLLTACEIAVAYIRWAQDLKQEKA